MIITIENWNIKNSDEFVQFVLTNNWDFEIKKYKKNRTNDQNRYLWWVVYKTIAEYSWNDDEYIHWVMSMKFLVDNTKKMPYVKSTSTLDTAEFTEYIENIKNFVAEFWIIIPEPNIL